MLQEIGHARRGKEDVDPRRQLAGSVLAFRISRRTHLIIPWQEFMTSRIGSVRAASRGFARKASVAGATTNSTGGRAISLDVEVHSQGCRMRGLAVREALSKYQVGGGVRSMRVAIGDAAWVDGW